MSFTYIGSYSDTHNSSIYGCDCIIETSWHDGALGPCHYEYNNKYCDYHKVVKSGVTNNKVLELLKNEALERNLLFETNNKSRIDNILKNTKYNCYGTTYATGKGEPKLS